MNPVDDHRDPELEAAWRAASREQPPAALDAAITAAARRAVGAGPKSLHAPRAWWPVAAAAVVAVIAIGIVEMTPPEQVLPTVTTAAPQPAPAPSAEPGARQDAMRDQRAPAASEPPRAKTSKPFPASPSDSRAADATVPPIDRTSEAPARSKMRQRAAPASAGANTQAPASAARDARESAPAAAAGTLAPRDEPKPSSAPALAKRAQDKPATGDEAPQRSVDEWIALIRRLKAEGRNDLAAKELAAFRARYQERADALLPADLREPRP